VFAQSGANPLVLRPQNQAHARFLAYTFVESGLPVVVCYAFGPGPGHAVTLVGHLLPCGDGSDQAESDFANLYPGEPDQQSSRHKHHALGQAIQLYYAHDDNYGPFHRIQFVGDAGAKEARRKAREDLQSLMVAGDADQEQQEFLKRVQGAQCLLATGTQEKPKAILEAMIVPLPRYVQGRPEPVVKDAIGLVNASAESAGIPEGSILWRCQLVDASHYKLSMAGRQYGPGLRAIYAQVHLPKFAWLVEFTCLKNDGWAAVARQRAVDGEFIYDASSPSIEPLCLSERLDSRVRNHATGGRFTEVNDPGKPICYVSP